MFRTTTRAALAITLIAASFALTACMDGRPDRDHHRHGGEHRPGDHDHRDR